MRAAELSICICSELCGCFLLCFQRWVSYRRERSDCSLVTCLGILNATDENMQHAKIDRTLGIQSGGNCRQKRAFSLFFCAHMPITNLIQKRACLMYKCTSYLSQSVLIKLLLSMFAAELILLTPLGVGQFLYIEPQDSLCLFSILLGTIAVHISTVQSAWILCPTVIFKYDHWQRGLASLGWFQMSPV